MLLALQAPAGAIRPAALADTGAIAAKPTLPAPLTARFRDTGHALKAATQHLNAAKPSDGYDGAPPLPSGIPALAVPAMEAGLRYLSGPAAPRSSSSSKASVYRSRASPRAA